MKKRKLALVAIFALSTVMLFSGCESKQKKMQKAEETIKQTLTEKYNKDFEIIDLSTYDGGLGAGDTVYYGYAYDPDRKDEEKYSTFYVETNGSYKTTKDQYPCMLLQRPLNATIKALTNRKCLILTNIRTDYDVPFNTIRINSQTVLSSNEYYYDVNMIIPQAAPGNLDDEVNSISDMASKLASLGFKGILYVIYSDPTYVDTVQQYLYHNVPSTFKLDYSKCPVDVALDFANGGDHSAAEVKRQLLEDLN